MASSNSVGKSCTKCGVWRPNGNFSPRVQAVDGLNSQCNFCRNEARKKWGKATKYKTQPRKWAKFKLSEAEYEQYFIDAGYKCGCCHTTSDKRRLCLDHCHDTGRIRGVLCSNCNTALGLVHENIETLRNLIKYVGEHNDSIHGTMVSTL